MGEDVDVGVAVGGEDSDAAVFADQAVADREAFVLGCDVAEGVGRGGGEELRDVRA